MRDVAYGQIPRGARAERHERAAGWIEALGRPEDQAEMLAHHYLEALRLRRAAGQEERAELIERARLAARDAGGRALALGAFPAGARFYEAALELWPADDPERPDLPLGYGRSRLDDIAFDDRLLEEAMEGLLQQGNPEAAAEAQTMVGLIWLNRGDRDEAFGHLEGARRLVEDRAPSPEKAFVLQEISRAAMMADDFERAIELASESLRLAEEFGLDAMRARNLNTLGVARVHGGDNGGLRDLEEAVAIAAAANSHEEWAAAANLAWTTAVGRPAAGLGPARAVPPNRRPPRAGQLHPVAAGRARIPLPLAGSLGRGARDGGRVHPRGRGGIEPLHGDVLSLHARRDPDCAQRPGLGACRRDARNRGRSRRQGPASVESDVGVRSSRQDGGR